MKDLTELSISVLTGIASAFLYGLTLWHFYYWFLLPPFDLPKITYFESIGIYMVLTLSKGKSSLEANESNEQKVKRHVVAILLPLTALGFGWLIHLIIG